MPRNITHVIIADEAAKEINSKDIFNNLNAYHMGCVADDSFLYTSSPLLSTRLHGGLGDDTRAIIVEMMDQLKEEEDPEQQSEQRAFIYGYLSHMATDIAFHPLIYSISGSQLKENNRSEDYADLSKACHRYAETWLDLHLMREKKKSFDNFRPFRKIVANLAMRARLDDFFTDCYQDALKAKKHTWGDNFELQAQFHAGMTIQLMVDKITHNQTIGGILRKLDKIFHGELKLYTSGFYDFDGTIPQRLTAGSFVHPETGEVINKSIKDLEREAVKNTVDFVRAADDYIKFGNEEAFLKAVPNFNYDTGTVNKKLSDIRKRITLRDFVSVMVKDDKKSQNRSKNRFNKMLNILKSKILNKNMDK